MKHYNDVRVTPYLGIERDCSSSTYVVIASNVLRYNYDSLDGRTKWTTRYFCNSHTERWLDKHVRQGTLFQ